MALDHCGGDCMSLKLNTQYCATAEKVYELTDLIIIPLYKYQNLRQMFNLVNCDSNIDVIITVARFLS